MKLNKLLTGIKEVYGKYFPESLCDVSYSDRLYSSIFIRCYIGKDKEEFYNGIKQNDMINISFSIDDNGKQLPKGLTAESEIQENLTLENKSKSYLIKPNSQYLCYSSKSISFRKTKGNGEKIIKTLDKFFKKLHDELLADIEADNIHENHRELLIKKLAR